MSSDVRTIILNELYQFDTDNPRDLLEREILKKKINIDNKTLDSAVFYLEDKRYIQLGAKVGKEYRSLRITANGIDYFESLQKVRFDTKQIDSIIKEIDLSFEIDGPRGRQKKLDSLSAKIQKIIIQFFPYDNNSVLSEFRASINKYWKKWQPPRNMYIDVLNAMRIFLLDFKQNYQLYESQKEQPIQVSSKEDRKGSNSSQFDRELLIPNEILEKLPKEIQKTIEAVKLCYEHDHVDFCFMGIRKALSTAIHIKFRREGNEKELYDSKGEPYKLTKWIELAKQNKFLSSSLARRLSKEVKVFGDVGAHDYRIKFYKDEVPSIFKLLRLALDRMYYNEKIVKRKPITPSALSHQFDLARFKTNLLALDKVSDFEIRSELLKKIRDQTINLPYDGMPHNIRTAVNNLLVILNEEIKNLKMRKSCLDTLHIINARRDVEINKKIKDLFLPIIEDNYQDLTIEEKRYAIDIRQRLYEHNSNFLKSIMIDSIYTWSQEEFKALYKEIEFDRLSQEDQQEFKIHLFKLKEEAKKKQLTERKQRIEKLLELSVFR